MRRRVILSVDMDTLTSMLDLPDDVRVVGTALELLPTSVHFTLESGRFAPVEEGSPLPQIAAQVVESTEEGRPARRLVWKVALDIEHEKGSDE